MIDLSTKIAEDGFVVVDGVLATSRVAELIEAVGEAGPATARTKGERVYAMRNLLAVPLVRRLAESGAVMELVSSVLGPGSFVVRGLLFDKTPEANWKVAWHQDVTIAVQERRAVAGFGPWSRKAGIVHVQPPAEILEKMLAVRVHLDDCDADNGPLRVIPGSHRRGVIKVEELGRVVEEVGGHSCVASAGAVLLMRPLMIHASLSATIARHRRVIHLEYAAVDLPGGLKWCAV